MHDTSSEDVGDGHASVRDISSCLGAHVHASKGIWAVHHAIRK